MSGGHERAAYRETDTVVAALSVRLPTVEDTLAYGRKLGRMLQAGDLVLLAGSLGAGKTTLTKGIAEGMGVSGRVASPTFVLAREHPGTAGGTPLVHVDAYRIGGDLSQLDDLDLDTDLDTAAVVVEWGEGLAELLADDYLVLHLERESDENRSVDVEPHGAWAERHASLTR